jgi:hypothetical protein
MERNDNPNMNVIVDPSDWMTLLHRAGAELGLEGAFLSPEKSCAMAIALGEKIRIETHEYEYHYLTVDQRILIKLNRSVGFYDGHGLNWDFVNIDCSDTIIVSPTEIRVNAILLGMTHELLDETIVQATMVVSKAYEMALENVLQWGYFCPD